MVPPRSTLTEGALAATLPHCQCRVLRDQRLKGYYVTETEWSDSQQEGSASLDALLTLSVQNFLNEVQKDTDLVDAMEAERLGKVVLEQLRYLVTLDKVAAKKEQEGGGMRWFVDIDDLGSNTEKFGSSEAGVIAS